MSKVQPSKDSQSRNKARTESSPLFESMKKDAVIWFLAGNLVLLGILVSVGMLAQYGGIIPE